MLKTLERTEHARETARADVVVIGGGIAGLLLAARLSKNGTRTVVLESGTEKSNEESHPLNEVVQSDEFKKRMSALGMAPPPAADNTPEKFDKFMREEVARQGEMAEQSGQKLKPQPK